MIKNQSRIYDLEERTLKFAEGIVQLAKDLPKNEVNQRLIPQMVDAGTSVGANYREANGAVSRKDFINKLGISRKEAKETEFWLRVVFKANPDFEKRIKPLLQEATELVKIFSSIIDKSKK